MTEAEEAKTDASSIKPVSSLRSHFENITSSKPATPVQAIVSDVRSAKHEQKNGLPVGRSSLDSKRVPSRSVTPTDKRLTKEGQEEGKNTGGSLRSQTSELARGQRNVFVPTPVLVNPTPTLTIESPRSSSSSFHLPNPAANNASVSHTSLTSAGLESSSPFSPPGHLETQTPRLEKRGTPDSFKGDTKHSKARVPSPHRIFGQGANPNLRSLPPPVNRAEKPKVPPKRVIDNVPGRASLEPEVSTPNEGVSPFSTPPSSDNESPGVDGPSTEARNRLDVKPAQLGGLDGYSPRTLPVKPSQDHNSRHGHISDSNAKAIDARLDDFSRYRDNAMDMPSQRPGLPPRIGEEVSPRPLTINVPEVPRGVRKDDANVQPHGAQHSLSPSLPKHRMVRSSTDFLPPPRRTLPSHNYTTPARRSESPAKRAIPSVSRVSNDLVRSQMQTNDANGSDEAAVVGEVSFAVATEYPDISQSSRRKPKLQRGAQEIDTRYDTRLLDICGEHVCTSGFLTRAWDLTTGENIMSLSHGEKELKVTALAFRPEATADKEGSRIWIGTNFGDLQEVDLSIKEVTSTKTNGHSRREITQIHRCQYNMWTLDEDGRLLVWKPEVGGLPTLQGNPISHKVPKGHTFSIVAKDQLWHATGKEIRVFRPNSDAERSFFITTTPLCQPNTGDVTSGAMVSSQLARIYFGHSDGKITIYSTEDYSCLGVVNVSIYKINSMAGAGDFLWAGYNTGMIYVYDTRTHPWTVKKDWHAHANPVVQIIADKSSVWKLGVLQVASLGTDNVIKMWEGMLEDDWLESDMQDHDTEYCDFRELKAVVVTWNAGASTPSSLSGGERSAPFKAAIKVEDPPDILVFGFQELVDLEDKKLTAKSFFKGKKKDPSEQEHMSRQYRDWRDYLTRYLEDNMPASHSYQLLHTASLVGLFSCVYVKTSERSHVHKLSAAEIKRGMGGLHGNKGALVLRFMIDDSSLCFINCHLAAGQTQTVHRNNDIAAILEASILPSERDAEKRRDFFIGGGDGSMIMDHEICILNGDLNYRIDTMGRDTVVKAIKAKNLAKLLERDQLLVSRRRNPGFRLRAFMESPITFAPTYKYDIGTDQYDTSEKHRSPAWCDRLLYRGVGRIKQTEYKRHDVRVSDHRPVSGAFRVRIKAISQKKRVKVWQECEIRLAHFKQNLARETNIDYLVSTLGLESKEALALVKA